MTDLNKDSKTLMRTAQNLIVDYRQARGSPPVYDVRWQPLWNAKVDRIEINSASASSIATIWFPPLRWHNNNFIRRGDMVRIRTAQPSPFDRTVVFQGFVTANLRDFSGGDEKTKAWERCAIVCQDYRWLLSVTSPLFGQVARGPDDFTEYGTEFQAPIDNSFTFLSGRRCIFNANGKPNMDPVELAVQNSSGSSLGDTPIFATPETAVPWTARDMIRYILSPIYNKAWRYFPIDPSGLDHEAFDSVLTGIAVEGLTIPEALELVCKNLGLSYREDYTSDSNDNVSLVFYKVASATGYTRDDDNPIVLHELYAPAEAETIDTAVAEGQKLLWNMTLSEDIAAVVNNPWGLGTPDRFEFTAELVPAWLDADLDPDTSLNNTQLYFTEADLESETDPDSYPYYKYYHPRGSQFKRDVGRKWVLNETGKYSPDTSYDRGMPFNFADVIPAEHILDDSGKRLFAPFARQLLPCLTFDKDSLNSVGIKVEFSFDGGSTWQQIPAAISSLSSECGIYIDEANLAEMADQKQGTITDDFFTDVNKNLWTSLCSDKLDDRWFKEGEWDTRVRVTASVQMDRRLFRQHLPSPASGSPFHQSRVFDFSDKYGISQRTESSIFEESDLPARNIDRTEWFDKHLEHIRDANEDMSIAGQFTLERLWLGDGTGVPAFALGDCIERITGRQHELAASFGSGFVYPEIIKIIYVPDAQKTKLITRDLRFAEVLL